MIQVEYEKIPHDRDDFIRWALKHKSINLHILSGGKRAWCSTFGSYLEGFDCVLYVDGEPCKFAMLKDLKDDLVISAREIKVKEKKEGNNKKGPKSDSN